MIFAGHLGGYKYYDMDKAIAPAFELSATSLAWSPRRRRSEGAQPTATSKQKARRSSFATAPGLLLNQLVNSFRTSQISIKLRNGKINLSPCSGVNHALAN